MNEPAIKIEQVSKCFGTKWALKDLSIELYPGEILALLGPNAAGKTTTIKLITGLLIPTKGRILIKGYDIQRSPLEAKRFLGYIPDEPYLYEKLTAEEFMEFIAGIYGIDDKKWKDKMEYYFKLFEIDAFRDQLIADYSHGMRQKLIFSATFLHEPDVIVIDEPLVGLDPNSARKVKKLLKEKAKEGKAIFVSTHTLSFAEEVATRIAIIDQGKLIALGTMEELRSHAGITGKLEEIFLKITLEDEAQSLT